MCPVPQEIRRVSDPDKAQIIWDGIKTVRAQKQIPALPRLSRYMNRWFIQLTINVKNFIFLGTYRLSTVLSEQFVQINYDEFFFIFG